MLYLVVVRAQIVAFVKITKINIFSVNHSFWLLCFCKPHSNYFFETNIWNIFFPFSAHTNLTMVIAIRFEQFLTDSYSSSRDHKMNSIVKRWIHSWPFSMSADNSVSILNSPARRPPAFYSAKRDQILPWANIFYITETCQTTGNPNRTQPKANSPRETT